MTGQTFWVEIHGLRVEVVMRIVAGQAADARVLRVIAFAPREAVGLEADVGNARIRLRRYFRPGAVTLPAEIGSLFCREADELVQVLGRRQVVVAGHHCGQVRVDSLMTVPALDPRSQFIQGELLSLHSMGRMASKATSAFHPGESIAPQPLR